MDQAVECGARYSELERYPDNCREQDSWVAIELACLDSCKPRCHGYEAVASERYPSETMRIPARLYRQGFLWHGVEVKVSR